jgi:hypothetical protein
MIIEFQLKFKVIDCRWRTCRFRSFCRHHLIFRDISAMSNFCRNPGSEQTAASPLTCPLLSGSSCRPALLSLSTPDSGETKHTQFCQRAGLVGDRQHRFVAKGFSYSPFQPEEREIKGPALDTIYLGQDTIRICQPQQVSLGLPARSPIQPRRTTGPTTS